MVSQPETDVSVSSLLTEIRTYGLITAWYVTVAQSIDVQILWAFISPPRSRNKRSPADCFVDKVESSTYLYAKQGAHMSPKTPYLIGNCKESE